MIGGGVALLNIFCLEGCGLGVFKIVSFQKLGLQGYVKPGIFPRGEWGIVGRVGVFLKYIFE